MLGQKGGLAGSLAVLRGGKNNNPTSAKKKEPPNLLSAHGGGKRGAWGALWEGNINDNFGAVQRK